MLVSRGAYRCVGGAWLTENIHDETDEAMVRCKGQQNLVDEENMFEVIEDTLSVQVIHGDGKKVPVQGSCQGKILLLGWDLRDSDDFFEGDDLNGSNDHDDVDVASEHRTKEAGNHDKRPYCSCVEGGLLLFIL